MPNVRDSAHDAPEYSDLWVCFEVPPGDPPSPALLLSFLPPGEEVRATERWGSRVLSGRDVVQEVRGSARRAYLDLIARIGATRCVAGQTLREALTGPDGESRWWFLKVSEKDCVWDGDPTYTTLLRLFAVKAVAEKYGLSRFMVHGGPAVFAEALEPRRRHRWFLSPKVVALGIVRRLGFFCSTLRRWWVVKSLRPLGPPRCDVLLQAHWDWSLGPNGGGLRERYFADLPDRLAARGVTVGWLASAEPDVEVWQRGRRIGDVLRASVGHPQVMLLERFLKLSDLISSAFNLRYPLAVSRFMRSGSFRELLRVEGFDLYPVLQDQLSALSWGAGICRWELIAKATERTCRELRPRMLLTFLELFLHSKAMYAGARRGWPSIKVWTAQHAAYCSDKTFGVLDFAVDLEGRPDGHKVPAPDGIFVMGELSRKIWLANGFPQDRVLVTGGLRYQGVAVEERTPVSRSEPSVTLLLIGGMNTSADLDMCDAVTAAARDLPKVRVMLRDHPQYCLSEKAGFRRYRERITVMAASAEEDLAGADIVLFTHSAFAEEALLRGIPTWQWLWPGFNTSVFVDLPVIPAFTSVGTLRQALESFLLDPARFQPGREVQQCVFQQCFGSEPARAAERIADKIVELTGAE